MSILELVGRERLAEEKLAAIEAKKTRLKADGDGETVLALSWEASKHKGLLVRLAGLRRAGSEMLRRSSLPPKVDHNR